MEVRIDVYREDLPCFMSGFVVITVWSNGYEATQDLTIDVNESGRTRLTGRQNFTPARSAFDNAETVEEVVCHETAVRVLPRSRVHIGDRSGVRRGGYSNHVEGVSPHANADKDEKRAGANIAMMSAPALRLTCW